MGESSKVFMLHMIRTVYKKSHWQQCGLEGGCSRGRERRGYFIQEQADRPRGGGVEASSKKAQGLMDGRMWTTEW